MPEEKAKRLETNRLIMEHLRLPDDLEEHVDEHVEEFLGGKAPIIWLQGMSCTGCSSTLMNSDRFNPTNLSAHKLSLRYQPNLMGADGKLAIDIIEETEHDYKGKYLVVLEGAMPTGDGEDFCTFGLSDETFDLMGNPVPGNKTIFNWLVELIPDAEAVLAVGNCASYGGIPAMISHVTGAAPALEVVEAIDPSKPVINVPGCPPHPDWIVGSFIDLLLWIGDHKEAPVLDDKQRLKQFYEWKIHDNCERRPAFEEKRFLEDWNDVKEDEDRCLLKMGCRGPKTNADCPLRLWSFSTTWCVQTNAPCHGCTNSDFQDKLPHMR